MRFVFPWMNLTCDFGEQPTIADIIRCYLSSLGAADEAIQISGNGCRVIRSKTILHESDVMVKWGSALSTKASKLYQNARCFVEKIKAAPMAMKSCSRNLAPALSNKELRAPPALVTATA